MLLSQTDTFALQQDLGLYCRTGLEAPKTATKKTHQNTEE